MSKEAKKPYNPPAFPSPETERTYFEPGMTLRDYFAGQAIAGFCSLPRAWQEGPINEFAFIAYAMADAMLRGREGDAAE